MKSANNPNIDYKKLVRSGYDECAADYNIVRKDESEPELQSLIKRLDEGALVLDIGCGGGVPVCQELSKKCDITGIDISPVQIAYAKRNVPTGKFICDDIMTISFPEETYDAVVSFYTVFHIPKEQHNGLFKRVHFWLKPGGYFMATLAQLDEEPYTEDDFFGVSMYWSNFGVDRYKDMLTAIGFQILKENQLGEGFNDDADKKKVIHPLILAQKPKI